MAADFNLVNQYHRNIVPEFPVQFGMIVKVREFERKWERFANYIQFPEGQVAEMTPFPGNNFDCFHGTAFIARAQWANPGRTFCRTFCRIFWRIR